MFENFRKKIAALISPEMAEDAKKYLDIYEAVYDVKDTTYIPEVEASCRWILGKIFISNLSRDTNLQQANETLRRVYPEYAKFPSLVHFRDIQKNEYNRKTNGKI